MFVPSHSAEIERLGTSSSSTTSAWTSRKSTHSSEWIRSTSAALSHETFEAATVSTSHLCSHKHLEYFIGIDSTHSSSTSWHTIEAELHSAWHTTTWESTHSIIHVIRTISKVVLPSLFFILEDSHCFINLFELLLSLYFFFLFSLTVPVGMPVSSEFSICLLNIIICCIFWHSQDLIVILLSCFLCVLLCIFEFLLYTEAWRVNLSCRAKVTHCLFPII